MKRILLGAVVGIGLVYFLDPTHGSKRRGKVTGLAGGSTPQPEPFRPQPTPTPPRQPAPPAASPNPPAATAAPPSPPASSAAPPPPTPQRAADSPKPDRRPKQDTGGQPHDNPNPDDNTLRDRVESELFANTEYSREHLNINVVDGTVEIRGELPAQQEIDDVVRTVSAVRNVKGVHNYLHLPGTPAPNKESALETP